LFDQNGDFDLSTKKWVLSFMAYHANIALLAPGPTPRVLDLVIVMTTRNIVVDRPIANSKHTVIELLAAVSVIENASLVQLEGRLIGLDSNRDRPRVQSWDHARFALNISETSNGYNRLARFLAGTVEAATGGVRVVRFSTQAVGFDPSERMIHEAAIAAGVSAAVSSIVTRDQVLLAELSQVLVVDLVGAFDGTHGGERPA
jgi:hypothetical protein